MPSLIRLRRSCPALLLEGYIDVMQGGGQAECVWRVNELQHTRSHRFAPVGTRATGVGRLTPPSTTKNVLRPPA